MMVESPFLSKGYYDVYISVTGLTIIRDFSDPIAFFFFFFAALPNQQHEISKIGKGAGLGTEKARIRLTRTISC